MPARFSRAGPSASRSTAPTAGCAPSISRSSDRSVRTLQRAGPMKPPLPHSESAVPRTLHAQLEIAKAMRTLPAPDEDELLRRRRAEIAAIRGELDAIKRVFQKAGEECLALAKAELRAALAKKYNPDQPRVSAGNRDGGQWTGGGSAA